MSPSSPPDVNYWYDKRCARAFWSQGEIGPYHQLQAHTAEWIAPGAGEDWLDAANTNRDPSVMLDEASGPLDGRETPVNSATSSGCTTGWGQFSAERTGSCCSSIAAADGHRMR